MVRKIIDIETVIVGDDVVKLELDESNNFLYININGLRSKLGSLSSMNNVGDHLKMWVANLKVPGTSGVSGFSGTSGWSGYSGISGTSGVSGISGLPVPGSDPSGVIKMYGGLVAPTGYFICDGSAVSRTTYSSLFAIIGTTFGAGNGTTTFNLPDLRQRFPLGKASSGTGNALGATGGNIDHSHTGVTGGPSDNQATLPLVPIGMAPTSTHTHTIASDNPPFQVVNFIIKQ